MLDLLIKSKIVIVSSAFVLTTLNKSKSSLFVRPLNKNKSQF